MARFKKRKSAPKHPAPKGDGSKAGSAGAATADPPPMPPSEPPSEPPVSVPESSEKSRKLNTLFWMRVILAVIAGTAATFIFEDIEGEDRRWASIALMVAIFIATVFIARAVMRIHLVLGADRKKIVTQAIGSYVFIYLFTWIVTYTLVNSGDISGRISIQ